MHTCIYGYILYMNIYNIMCLFEYYIKLFCHKQRSPQPPAKDALRSSSNASKSSTDSQVRERVYENHHLFAYYCSAGTNSEHRGKGKLMSLYFFFTFIYSLHDF